MNSLAAEGLNSEQRAHFAEHGWLLLEGVFDAEQREAYAAGIDSGLEYHNQSGDSETVRWLYDLELHDSIFLSWYSLPGIIEANRQLLGVSRPRAGSLIAAVTTPHPDRSHRSEELRNPDASFGQAWGWHREFRPSNGLRPSKDDSHSLDPIYLGNITYLTPVSAEHGVTAFLDGSHRLDGDYASLKERCSVVQPEAPAGSVIIFTETLIHSATPVLGQTIRYALFYDFIAPWVRTGGHDRPQRWVESIRNDELRLLFTEPTEPEPFDAL